MHRDPLEHSIRDQPFTFAYGSRKSNLSRGVRQHRHTLAATEPRPLHDEVIPVVLLLPRSGRELLLRHDYCDGIAVELERKRVRKSRCWRPPLPGLGVALCHRRARVCGCHGVLLKAQ